MYHMVVVWRWSGGLWVYKVHDFDTADWGSMSLDSASGYISYVSNNAYLLLQSALGTDSTSLHWVDWV